MKVSTLSTLPPIKGLSPYTLSLLQELSRNCEIEFYGFKSIYPEFLYPGGTKTDESQPNFKNVNIHNRLTWYNPFSWIGVGFDIDTKIFHVQWWSWVLSPMYLVFLSIAKLRGKKIIMTIHNVKPHEKSFVKNFLNDSVIGLADEYIVHNENNRKMFLDIHQTKKKVHVIPIGISVIKDSSKSKSNLRKQYGFSADDKILIFFGNIRDYKGLDVLIKSLSKIKDEKVKLIIAGKPWKDFEEYNKIIQEFNLQSKVRLFLGYNSNEVVSELFVISDVAVFPYKEFEASSAAAADGISHSKAIVITNVGGLPDLVKDKNVIAKPNNVEDLADKIIYSLRNINKLEKQSKDIAQKFLWKDVAKKTGEVYRR